MRDGERRVCGRSGAAVPADLDLALGGEYVATWFCPAEFEVGEQPQGALSLVSPKAIDNRLKYPVMFSEADACCKITKVDLLPYLPCGGGALRRAIRIAVNPAPRVFPGFSA